MRITFMVVLMYLVATSHRLGSLLPSRSSTEQPLRWSDLTVVVTKTGGAANVLQIKFTTPHGKTRKSKNLDVTLDQETNPALCPVFWLLALAHRRGAIEGWRPADLVAPELFADTQSAVRQFYFTSDEPVFCLPSGVPIITDHVHSMFRRISNALRFAVPITAHSLRSSVALALKWAGVEAAGIQAQLRHSYQSSTTRAYTGSVA